MYLDVIPVSLAAQTTRHSEWFYADCLCDKHNCTVFSNEFFEIAANYFKMAAEHSIDTILTPLFTPSLDIEEGGRRMPCQLVKIFYNPENQSYTFDFSLFKRWVQVAQKNGIEFFEIVPLFTQWGAKFAIEIYAQTPEGEKTIFGWNTPSDDPAYLDFLTQCFAVFLPCLQELGIAEKTFFHISDEPALEHLSTYQTAYQKISPYLQNFAPLLTL